MPEGGRPAPLPSAKGRRLLADLPWGKSSSILPWGKIKEVQVQRALVFANAKMFFANKIFQHGVTKTCHFT